MEQRELVKEDQVSHKQYCILLEGGSIELQTVFIKFGHNVTIIDEETGEKMECVAYRNHYSPCDDTEYYTIYKR